MRPGALWCAGLGRQRRSARRPSSTPTTKSFGLYCRRMISRIDSTIARMMPCSTPTAKTTMPVIAAITNSLRPPARIRLQAGDVDQADTDQEHDRREHRLGHVGEQAGEEQHHEQHDHRTW